MKNCQDSKCDACWIIHSLAKMPSAQEFGFGSKAQHLSQPDLDGISISQQLCELCDWDTAKAKPS
jgi:hypothetical protein